MTSSLSNDIYYTLCHLLNISKVTSMSEGEGGGEKSETLHPFVLQNCMDDIGGSTLNYITALETSETKTPESSFKLLKRHWYFIYCLDASTLLCLSINAEIIQISAEEHIKGEYSLLF